MPPKTRKTKKEEPEEDPMMMEEGAEPNEDEIKISTKIPESDESYERKIFVAKTGTMANSRIIKLRHPREGCALFRLSEEHFDEILSISDGHRSFFYGDTVISNGSIHMLCPFNPVFICLPYLQKTAQKFVEIDEILKEEQEGMEEGIKEMAGNERVQRLLETVCDVKDLLDVKLFRLNEEKMLEWMSKKFDALKEQLKMDVHKSLRECPEALDRHIFSFFSDFLSPEHGAKFKIHQKIVDSTENENHMDQSMHSKRKALEDEEFEFEKPVIKKAKESIQTKKLAAASKGTKSISSFFAKKN